MLTDRQRGLENQLRRLRIKLILNYFLIQFFEINEITTEMEDGVVSKKPLSFKQRKSRWVSF